MCSPEQGSWPETARRPGKTVDVTSADGSKLPVHIATPEGEGPWPTVVIVHDYFDPEHFYHELAARYAGAGYCAVVPSFFHREGALAEQTHEAAGARIGAVSDDGVFEDIAATLVHLDTEGISTDLALTGFCWGGRATYLVGARFPQFRVLLPFYGFFVAWSGPDGPKPYAPMDEVDRISAPVIGAYGATDDSIPHAEVVEMERRLIGRGVAAELTIYDGCPHGFFRLPECGEQSQQAWDRVLSALHDHVGTPAVN